jgi:hypothetical protein
MQGRVVGLMRFVICVTIARGTTMPRSGQGDEKLS